MRRVESENKGLISESRRCAVLERLVALGLLAGLLVSAPLWTGASSFPPAPLFETPLEIPSTVRYLLFVALLASLLAVSISRYPRRWLRVSLLLLALFLPFDQMRWQPWVLQYTALGVLLISRPRCAEVANSCRLILAATYFYSGLQKLNFNFVFSVFPWMLEPFVHSLPEFAVTGLYLFGVFVPFIEIAIGVGLLSRRYRQMAIVLVCCTIGFVLLSLGPFGHRWNSVVWVWNAVLLLMVFTLFWGASEGQWRELLPAYRSVLPSIVLFIFVLLPPLSFFNLWDSYPSFALYSGNTNMAYLVLSEDAVRELPKSLRSRTKRTQDGRLQLSILNWSMEELNVPPYPERRVFIRLAAALCQQRALAGELRLVLQGRPSWFNAELPEELDCSGIRDVQGTPPAES